MSTNINQIGSAGRDAHIGDKNTKITISIGAIVIIAIIAIIVAVSSGGTEKKIIGKWQTEGSDEIYEFTKDGQFLRLTGSSDGLTVTYTIDGERLYLNMNILWANATVSADVSVDNHNLVLSNFMDPDDMLGFDSDDEWKLVKVD